MLALNDVSVGHRIDLQPVIHLLNCFINSAILHSLYLSLLQIPVCVYRYSGESWTWQWAFGTESQHELWFLCSLFARQQINKPPEKHILDEQWASLCCIRCSSEVHQWLFDFSFSELDYGRQLIRLYYMWYVDFSQCKLLMMTSCRHSSRLQTWLRWNYFTIQRLIKADSYSSSLCGPTLCFIEGPLLCFIH